MKLFYKTDRYGKYSITISAVESWNKIQKQLKSTLLKDLSPNCYVTDWLNANKLTLNVEKSNLVLFRSTKKTVETLNIKIKGEQIQEKDYTKYLGTLIDNKLSWNCHIKHVNLKISKGIGILTKLRRYLSKVVLRTLYYALFNHT